MAARITPLRLEAFDQLPKHARRCVYWEVDPSTLGEGEYLSDPEFDKEAWLSMVMLEWGSCGQLAVPAVEQTIDAAADAPSVLTDDEHALGYAFYAPPRAIPRARMFPSGPVSADAVLLTSLRVEPGHDADGLSRSLIASVVTDLVRRGVRALEAFGHTVDATELSDPHLVGADVKGVIDVLGDCSVEQCMLSSDMLQDNGFTIVSRHRYFPRLRLELEQGLGWKASVEAALERLVLTERIEQPVGASVS